jgi:hypothetical protein
MKKILFVLMVFLGIALNIDANEKNSYLVTITVQVNYEYYDENGDKVGESIGAGTPQTIRVQARTPEEARSIALDECSTMCRQGKGLGKGKDEGKRKYGNKYYQCYSTKEPYEVISVIQKN